MYNSCPPPHTYTSTIYRRTFIQQERDWQFLMCCVTLDSPSSVQCDSWFSKRWTCTHPDEHPHGGATAGSLSLCVSQKSLSLSFSVCLSSLQSYRSLALSLSFSQLLETTSLSVCPLLCLLSLSSLLFSLSPLYVWSHSGVLWMQKWRSPLLRTQRW